jgi:tetratricopeptide (TPR) repeat protein
MKRYDVLVFLPVLLIVVFALALGGCGKKEEGKIPITTSSSEALSQFLEGRTLAENLRLTDAIGHFQKALEKDPNFAMAHLYLAQSAGTAKEFFDHMKQAVALSDKASEGERLWILGSQAGFFADPMKQRELYQKLVTLFPTDQRALMLLGTNYFGQQDYAKAIEYLKKATAIAPDYAPAYNQLGYAHRFLNQFADAENAFKKYTELIPNDPNPYDSYAELLLKMGRFDEAISQYQKALSRNPQFANSFTGIAAALMYTGKYDDARAELQKAYDAARNDGEQRAALFTKTVVYIDEGKPDLALQEMDKQYAIAEKTTDVASMATDLTAMGSILLETGKYDDAKARFTEAADIVAQSDLPPAVKEHVEMFRHFNAAQVALMKKDFKTANAELDQFRQQAEASKNENQIRLVHELGGMIALEQKNYDATITELERANQQNPYNHYRIALAYQAKGDKDRAKQYFMQAAKFNGVPLLNYAFIRTKAEKMLAKT